MSPRESVRSGGRFAHHSSSGGAADEERRPSRPSRTAARLSDWDTGSIRNPPHGAKRLSKCRGRSYDAGVHLFVIALGLRVIGSFGSLLRRLRAARAEPEGPGQPGSAPRQLRGGHAARRRAALDPARGARETQRRRAPSRRCSSGIIVFFVLEKLVIWRHCHSDALRRRTKCTGAPGRPRPHRPRVPQLRGRRRDRRGRADRRCPSASAPPSRWRCTRCRSRWATSRSCSTPATGARSALGLSVLSAAGAVAGTVVVVHWLFDHLPGVLPFALAFAAASFLYIAMADLMPDLHRGQRGRRARSSRLILLGAGIATAFGLRE